LFNNDNTVTAVLDKPVVAVSAGQYLVFYKGDQVLGNAVIL